MPSYDLFNTIQSVFKSKVALIAEFNKSDTLEVQNELARSIIALHDYEMELIARYNNEFLSTIAVPA